MVKFFRGALGSSTSDSDASSSSATSTDSGVAVVKQPIQEKQPLSKAAKKKEKLKAKKQQQQKDSSESEPEPVKQSLDEKRKMFLKKDDQPSKTTTEKEQRRKVDIGKKASDEESGVDEDAQSSLTSADPWERQLRKKDAPLFDPSVQVTPEMIVPKLTELDAKRGHPDERRRLVVLFSELLDIAISLQISVGVLTKIHLCSLAAMFENKPMAGAHARDFGDWCEMLKRLDALLELLIANPELRVSMQVDEENLTDANKPIAMRGSALMLVLRLDHELKKIFVQTDSFSKDYDEKLKGESNLVDLLEKSQRYIQAASGRGQLDAQEVNTVTMLQIEHLYYKQDKEVEQSRTRMATLCARMYANARGTPMRPKAVLCQLYHHAIHGRFYEARELLLMSHVTERVERLEADAQILYNRAIIQLGMCAFRCGLFKEAHQLLTEIQNAQNARDLIGQAQFNRRYDEDEQKIKLQRSLQLPYHMHINTEQVECVYLLVCMLLEASTIPANEYKVRKPLISRTYHYQLKMSEGWPVVGEPETLREFVMAATRAMLKGEWEKCLSYVFHERIEKKVWSIVDDPVRAQVTQLVKEECLRCYLFTYAGIYKNISIAVLEIMFGLKQQEVRVVINKAIYNEELFNCYMSPCSDYLVAEDRVEPSYDTVKLADQLDMMMKAESSLRKEYKKLEQGEDRKLQEEKYGNLE